MLIERGVMDPAYLSAVAALAGSAIGGLTSLAASWVTQRVQVSAQQLAHHASRREDLYNDFIDEASNSYADALQHTEADVAKTVRLYALVSRMRILSSRGVIEGADAVMGMIMDTYRAPNRTIYDEADSIRSGRLDPLLNFSEACREEFRTQAAVGPRLRSEAG
jgi:hypothetical protein